MISEERYIAIKNNKKFASSIRGKLEHLQRFLHEGSASVMVGAGFSRNAEHDPNIEVKDWKGLALDFYKRLYGGTPKDENLALKSALRLAMQVECQYGRDELNRIIEDAVPNNKLKPGPLHKALVNLPWRDIFTTNYDQLLEHTPSRQSYNVVTNRETLLYKNHPRIVKLHGSSPDIKPYVITEEDYRTYPDIYPEFVNTVRQSLIESALCLIGFSGDDPNFLSWIGWIRDKMGERLAPIYMFDVSDNGLHESELALFRKRKIEVISCDRTIFHSIDEYFDFIFKFLRDNPIDIKGKAWDASVGYDEISKISHIKIEGFTFSTEVDAKAVKDLIDKYRHIRTTYPGWLLMPVNHLRSAFEENFSHELSSIKSLIDTLPFEERINLLFELEWRIRMSFVPISLLKWYESSVLLAIEEKSSSDILKDNRLTALVISLMSYYRQVYNKTEFDRMSGLVSSVVNTADTDNIRRYFYERCLSAISSLDYQEAHRLLSLWSPAPEDYLGNLWKCAIMTEVGLSQDAYSQLSKAYQTLQYDAVGTTNTLYIDSAMSAYESVLRLYEPFSQRIIGFDNNREEYKLYNYFRYEKGRLHDLREKSASDDRYKSRTHEFNLNHVVTHYSMGRNRDSEGRFAGRIQMVWESFGYPYYLDGMTIDSSMMKLSSDTLLKSGNGMLALNVLIRSAQKDTIKSVLTKEMIMSLDKDKIQELFDHFLMLSENLQNWDNCNSFHLRLGIIITEILRRFVVVMDANRIAKLVPILLKIRDSKSHDYSSDSLRTIFNCLPESKLKEIYSILICASIESEEDGKDIIFPDIEDANIEIPEEAIEIIREAFKSDNAHTRNNAYIRVARIYRMCNPIQQKELAGLVISWRNQDMTKNINATYSFNVVPHDEQQDNYSIEDRLKWSISSFEDNSGDDNNAKDIEQDVVAYTGKADDNFCVLEALVKKIPQEQVQVIANIIDKALGDIIRSAKHGNSTWAQAFGFNKKYQYRTIAYIIANLEFEFIDSDTCKSICFQLKELADAGYPKLLALSKVNQHTLIISDIEFGILLKKCVLSHDERIRKNAFSYMAIKGFDQNNSVWDTIWSKIRFSSSPEVADYLSLVIDTLEIHDFDPNSIAHLPQIIDEVKVNIEEESWLDGDRYDLQYQMLKLVGFISLSSPNQELKVAISKWIPTKDNSVKIPNDVLKGFEEGHRIWHKLHNIEIEH